MSGLEALSLVCSIMQVISFTKELITTCKDIYEGRATANGQLQENTASIKKLLDDMNQCSGSVQQHTQSEKDLHAIAQKCSSAAQDLQTEIQRLTQYHKPGNVVKAFFGGIKSFARERKIKELSTRFRQYQETLETHILVHLCTKADALQFQQQSKFTELSTTMQNFISQIAAGHTEMANLLRHDGIKTRQQIQQSETHVKDSINAIYVDSNMEAKRNRLLQSLKFESMNARRTEIKIANEATYVSFFKSLEFKTEPTSRSAAAAWAGFVNWLQSDEQTFWIQGKPGAGKSTLIKFLLQHENTHKALEKWNHNPLIVSHFFWKPGEILQKNLRGLLCSLNHQLLSSEPTLIDQTLPQFKFSRENDSVRDWEISDLIIIFTFILKSYNKPIFFLIDGVDEAANPEEVLEFLTSSFTLRNTKWCVSSRGEERFQQAFSKYNGFKLNEYTEDEMLNFAWKEIEYTLKSIQGYENMYTEHFLKELQQSLVDKAEGVFLWLVLALESIKRGLRHNDKTDVILSRLRKLPTGLEELYADMWDRLGEDKDIYQREAAHYFNLLIINRTLLEEFNERYETQIFPFEWPMTPFQIMLSQDERLQRDLLNKSYKLQLSELGKKCSGITRSISIKTAGLLIIQEKSDSQDSLRVRKEYPQLEKHATSKIEFVHRSLFDFLKDTESGKAILAQAHADRVYVQLATILLCQLRIMRLREPERYWEDDIVSDIENGVFRYFLWLVNQAQRHNSYSKESIFDTLLLPFETLFEAHLIPWDRRPKPHPRPCFEILLLNDPAFEPFIKERLECKGASYATRVLREYMFVKDAKFVRPHNSCVDVVEFLLGLGADINSTDACFYEPRGGIVENGQFIGWFIYESALSAMIKRLCSKPENNLSFTPGTPSCELLRYLVAFLEGSPNLNTHTSFLLATPVLSRFDRTEDRGWGMNLLLSVAAGKKHFGGIPGKSYYPAAVTISEVNLKYLVGHFLKRASSKDTATNALLTRAQQLVQLEGSKEFVKTRFIVSTGQNFQGYSLHCYQFINEDIDVIPQYQLERQVGYPRAGSSRDPRIYVHTITAPRITIEMAEVEKYIKVCEKVDVSALSILLHQNIGVCLKNLQ